MTYLFEYGFSPQLAARELHVYFSSRKIKYKRVGLNQHIHLISYKTNLQPSEYLSELGGTIRIAALVGEITPVKGSRTEQAVIDEVCFQLQKNNPEQVTFAITSVDVDIDTQLITRRIKETLQTKGISSRYKESKQGLLSPIVHSKPVEEYIVCPSKQKNGLLLFKTVACTDVKDWQKRDRKRPAIDAKSGVLPPKVARMMVNIAIKSPQKNQHICDPFCGSGTVLMEALLLGHQAQGYDISSQAVSDTKSNLSWLESNYDIGSWKVSVSDITTKNEDDSHKYDAIVAEGYLGPSRFESADIPTIIDSLKPLYKQALPQIKNMLKPKAGAVLALPWFESPANQAFQSFLIDTIEKSGYTLSVKPVIYGHKKSRVKRAIFILE